MKRYEMLPTEENLIETLYNDTINRNKDIVYFYDILQAQESASAIAIDGRWGSGKTFFVGINKNGYQCIKSIKYNGWGN